MANAEYRIGDEATISGVVVHVGISGGNHEYTIAVNDPDSERPINVPATVAPQAQANGEEETRKLNAERYAEVAKETEKADKESDENNEESIASGSTNSDKARSETAAKTGTPDPAKVPAGGKANTAAK